MDIISGLAGLKTASELVRIVRDAAKTGTLKPDEFAGRVGEIYDYIVDSKDALVEAKNRIQDLESQLAAKNGTKQIDSELDHDGYVYWRNHLDTKRSGPYCTYCWGKDDRLIPLRRIPDGLYYEDTKPSNRYHCVAHGDFYVPTGESPRQRPQPISRVGSYSPWS